MKRKNLLLLTWLLATQTTPVMSMLNELERDEISKSSPHAAMSECPQSPCVFDAFVGKKVTLGYRVSENQYNYLDSFDQKVLLSPQTSGVFTGTHWGVEKNFDQSYSFKSLGFQGDENMYLNSVSGNVFLSSHRGGGMRWTVDKNADQTYSFRCIGPQGNENRYLDSHNGTAFLSPNTGGFHPGTHWTVNFLDLSSCIFDEYIGREIILENCSYRNKNTYLDSGYDKVHLSPQTSGIHTGTHWTVEKNPDNSYSFKSLGFQGEGNKYLDSFADNVHLSPHTGGRYTGTHWTAEKNPDQTYSFKCLGPQGSANQYLDSGDGNIRLSPRSGSVYMGTHWRIGLLDLKSSEVYDAIRKVYNAPIEYHKGPYQALTTHDVANIWKSSELGDYTYKLGQFQCCSYALCMKAECAKWIYHEQQLFKKKLPAFGTICGSKTDNNGEKIEPGHAYNFYITPYLELKLIEPQTGRAMGLQEWKPYIISIMQSQ